MLYTYFICPLRATCLPISWSFICNSSYYLVMKEHKPWEISCSHGSEYKDFRAFWDVAPCSLVRVNRRFRRAHCLHHKRWLIEGLFIVLMMEAVRTSETLVYSNETSRLYISKVSNLQLRNSVPTNTQWMLLAVPGRRILQTFVRSHHMTCIHCSNLYVFCATKF
jgi:hypothetical protein